MIDRIMKEKADLVSFSQAELSNIASTVNNLKSIVNNDQDFREPFLGGSYKRGTMVKGISDVDVYFRYDGTGTSGTALAQLKNHLINNYPNTEIKRDKPSILVDFNKIPVNITPYKEDNIGNMSIPDGALLDWTRINFGLLEKSITSLRQKSPDFIALIKLLKLWNRNYRKGIKNFEIELGVCVAHLPQMSVITSVSDCLWSYLQNNGFPEHARTVHALIRMTNESELRAAWLKFIDNK